MRLSRRAKWIGGSAAGVLVVIIVAAVVVYYTVIKSDAPPPLSFESVASSTTVDSSGGSTSSPASSSGDDASASGVDGSWQVTNASQVGYRVTEDLVGGIVNNTAVGRTNAVTGTLTLEGTKAMSAQIVADLTKLASDSGMRDRQVQTRILNTSTFPTATFTLSEPIDFGSVPDVGATIDTSATGDFTIHGVTRRVTFDVSAQRASAAELRVLGSMPVTWSDYDIPSPSFAGVASVRDNGTMEFLIVAVRETSGQ